MTPGEAARVDRAAFLAVTSPAPLGPCSVCSGQCERRVHGVRVCSLECVHVVEFNVVRGRLS